MAYLYYAVRRGRNEGIFKDWETCKAQVDGYIKAVFKGFNDYDEALAWMKQDKASYYRNLSTLRKGPMETPPAPKKAKEKKNDMSFAANATDYTVYTDGSCLKNPDGPGGWAAVIINNRTKSVIDKISGGCESTTNNRMELTAVMKALASLPSNVSVTLYTDSKYIQEAFQKNWVKSWMLRNWKRANGADVLNQDLWQPLVAHTLDHRVDFQWVKGHVGNKYNEECDRMAKGAAFKYAEKESSLFENRL